MKNLGPKMSTTMGRNHFFHNDASQEKIVSELIADQTRPGYFYLFGDNRDWNSRDNLKIFGKAKKFWVARSKQ